MTAPATTSPQQGIEMHENERPSNDTESVPHPVFEDRAPSNHTVRCAAYILFTMPSRVAN